MASNTVGVLRSRNVLRYLVRRDLALKYQQSVMGYAWSLLEPIGIGLIYYFVFIVVIGRGGRLAGILEPREFILFLMAGIFSYMWTSGVIGQATGALTGQKSLITTMNVPREVFPISKVLARSAEFLVGIPILAGIAIIIGADFTWWLLVLPLAVLVQGTFLIGIALILSSVNVMMRDIERFMSMISRLVFYSSPILYPLAMVDGAAADGDIPGWLVTIYKANPLVGIVELHHAVWFPQMFPSPALLITCIVGSLVTLLAGWLLFRRLEPTVLKEL